MHTDAVTKELIFKMRIDDKDKKRLDALAEHYSAPAATVVRILIKEKYDGLEAHRAATRMFSLDDVALRLLTLIAVDEKIYAESIARGVNPKTLDSTDAARLASEMDDMNPATLGAPLNALKKNGYVIKLKERGYVLTEQGRSALAKS